MQINEHKIFILFDENGDIWYSLKKLLLALNYTDTSNAIKTLDIDKEYITNIELLKVGGIIPPPHL